MGSRILFVLIFCGSLFSQTLTLHAQENYQQWLQKHRKAFQQFKDKRDKAFTEFLKQELKKFQAFQGRKWDETPKPRRIPRAKPLPPRRLPHRQIIKDIPLPKKVPPPRVSPPGLEEAGPSLEINFFNTNLKIYYDPAFDFSLPEEINKEVISTFWAELSQTNYEDFLKQMNYYREALQLNDWGYGMLLAQVASALYPKSKNQQNLFVWFMLQKSGYEAKFGLQDQTVYLLIASDNVLYGTNYFKLDGKNFYLVDYLEPAKQIKSLFTYEGNYPNANKTTDLYMKHLPNLKPSINTRTVKFKYENKSYNLSFQYDHSLIEFFQNYPQTDLEVYFATPLSPKSDRSILAALKPVIQGTSQAEAVNRLLRFVQTAFDYETDEQQFGREKFLFAEETLHYPYSDCEDRSILFAYLVTRLTGLDVIALDFPGHIATAVHFSEDVKGDYVTYENKKYVICDPTYINANIGMRMPLVKNATPTIIKINSPRLALQ
ncbi:MAG: hypothetical protein D6813_14265 [Calditrichaeota bacterium]|nr:MAG: hypothetical protein D6813_14265 [Calditrichota bacterium]